MITFVGAGPGAPDLITVRGHRALQAADVIVYAGSLVNPQLLELAQENCEIHNSAGMTLEQVMEVLVASHRKGKEVVRLHTGDPSLYGAVREQYDWLRREGIPFGVVPGVSSFLAAAASLQAEYTMPGVSQTVILTRAEGRTPVPHGEELESLARHGATLVLFLSASLLDEASRQLIEGGYSPQCPVAIVHKASWQDEQIFRTTLCQLSDTANRENIKKTALVVVGEFLGSDYEYSKLYDKHFSHEYRQGVAE